jgi:hypothetical protein
MGSVLRPHVSETERQSHGVGRTEPVAPVDNLGVEKTWMGDVPSKANSAVEVVTTERSQFDAVRRLIQPTKQSHRSGWCGFDR